MMSVAPPITEAESEVMEVLWTRGPSSAEDIIGEAVARRGWGPATVKTLINRLLKKQAIRSQRAEGRVAYHPLVSRDQFLAQESQSLLDRLFGGELAPLVAHYARRRALSPTEVAKLKALIAELDGDG